MTSQTAWRNFEKSGLVSDYLAYKSMTEEEGKSPENQHARTDNKGHSGAN